MSVRLETGVQFYYQVLDYNFVSSDTILNNNYAYNEWRNAAYAGFTLNKKKIGFQVNFRAERSDIEINKTTPDGYFTFLPSANVQYKFNSNQNVKLTYNRRINRPNIYNLNPNTRYSNTYIFTRGNPGLKPELRDRLQLTYTLNFGKSFLSPHVYYEILSDKVGNRNLLDKSPINGKQAIISQPQNLLTGYETGFGMSGFVKFIYLDARIKKGYFQEYSDTLSQINARDYFSYNLTSYLTAPLFKEKVNTFIFLNYMGVTFDAQSKTYNPFIYGFGANVKIKKNHTLGFFYVLPFQQELEFTRTITSTELLRTESSNNFNTSYFIQVQYHYKFNKGKAVKKIGKKSDIESDTKGGGLGR
jgi:outer membrane receptor protein involved in Fe transport